MLEEKRPPLVARMLGIAVVLVMGGVLVVWGVDLGRRIVGASHGQALPDLKQQLEDAEAEIARLTAERDALQAAMKAAGVPLPAAASGAGGTVSGQQAGMAPAAEPAAAAGVAAPAPVAGSTVPASAAAAGKAASGTITTLPPK